MGSSHNIKWPTGDEIIERTGSVIHWDTKALTPYKNRTRRTVLVTCGKCKKQRASPIDNVKLLIENNKWGYTGYCSLCRRAMTWAERYGRNKREEGNRYTDPRGYIRVYYPNNPMADHRGELYEHRYVMSQKVRRMLESWEHVHHKDGNKSDNRPENLELHSNSEHYTIKKLQAHVRHLESLLVKHNIPF